MANITKVPNGPLIKKKGPYAGSGLKSGGVIKKAQTGTTLTPQQKRAQMDSIAAVKRAEIVRKKDSILNRNATARGMTREQVRAQQEKDKKKPDAVKEDLTDCTKRTDKKGSCTTGNTGGGQSTKDNKRNGGPIKKSQNGTSEYSDPKPLFDKIKKSKDSLDNAMFKLKEKKFKSKMGYLKSKLKNKESEMTTKKAKAGAMIKRADGSMSRRGLWDNIRANKGSGKKPTKQMLVQEKKIKAKSKK
jgi:hypothetical protein